MSKSTEHERTGTMRDFFGWKSNSKHQLNNSFLNIFTVCRYTDSAIPPHFHNNLELIVVTEGNSSVILGNTVYDIKKGEAILAFSYQIHGFTVDKASDVLVVTFHKDIVKAFYRPTVGKHPIDPVFKLSNATFDYLTAKLCVSSGQGEFYSSLSTALELKAKSCLYAVCAEFLEQVTFEESKGDQDTITIGVLQYIAENYRDNITLQSVSDALGYNYQYVSRIFNTSTGYNFKNVLNQYRFEHAKQLLHETDMAITDVAFESGFQSLRTFNRVCFEMYETSPKQLRNDIRRINVISTSKI